jgi:hypothetical protein
MQNDQKHLLLLLRTTNCTVHREPFTRQSIDRNNVTVSESGRVEPGRGEQQHSYGMCFDDKQLFGNNSNGRSRQLRRHLMQSSKVSNEREREKEREREQGMFDLNGNLLHVSTPISLTSFAKRASGRRFVEDQICCSRSARSWISSRARFTAL